MDLEDRIWELLPARPPGRQQSAIRAELSLARPGVSSGDVARALWRLHTQRRALSQIRHGQERWIRATAAPAASAEADPGLWEAP